ncbi:ATP-binding protein [Psychrobacillus sp. FSL K6-2836]|uniref:ATP-binding protein n=1 Tax=Psychrobacillus sp. FSL K6-2836 TaxID=2921548 RepID=UPI0030FCFFEE
MKTMEEILQEVPQKHILSNHNKKVMTTEDGWEILNATSKCPYSLCDGNGSMHIVKEKAELLRECKCNFERRQKNKIKSAKVPQEYFDVTVGSYNIELYTQQSNTDKAMIAKRVAVKYVENFENMLQRGKGLFLYSETKGSGKTRLAISILNALIRKYQVNALYISSVNLLNEIKQTFQSVESIDTSRIIQTFKEVPLLVIDDLGVEKVSDWSEEMFTQILDERMSNYRPTIITSNFSISQLSKKYKMGRVNNRIEKMAFPIAMPEESVRSKLAKKENDEIAKLFFE